MLYKLVSCFLIERDIVGIKDIGDVLCSDLSCCASIPAVPHGVILELGELSYVALDTLFEVMDKVIVAGLVVGARGAEVTARGVALLAFEIQN